MIVTPCFTSLATRQQTLDKGLLTPTSVITENQGLTLIYLSSLVAKEDLD